MELMKYIPHEVIQNVNDSLDDQPLTDIKIHAKSFNDVMDMFKNTRPLTFIQVLHCFADWKKCNYFDEDFCFDYFSL